MSDALELARLRAAVIHCYVTNKERLDAYGVLQRYRRSTPQPAFADLVAAERTYDVVKSRHDAAEAVLATMVGWEQ